MAVPKGGDDRGPPKAALAAGATADEIVGALVAAAPITGVGRVLAETPELARALDYDLDAALEARNGDPG